MSPLLRLVVRGWLDRPGRTLLAIGGVALGVAVLLAVRLANYSAIEAFSRTLEMVSGRADIEIFAEGHGTIPPDLFAPITRMKGIKSAVPVYILLGQAGDQERRIRLLGVDLARDSQMRPWYRVDLAKGNDQLALFSNPHGVLLTPSLAKELNVRKGGKFAFRHDGRVDSLQVIGLLGGEDIATAQIRDVIVMDLPRAWQLAGGPHELSRIDVLLRRGIKVEDALAALRTYLPDGIQAEASGWRRPQAKRLLSSFRLNLTALAFVALLVAGFLVFQTVNTTALERRKIAGILRSMGGSRQFVRRLFLSEGAGIGILGSLAGIPLGLLLAQGAAKAVSITVTSIYLLETTDHVYINWEAVITSFLLGIAVSLASVWPIAVEASRVPPRESWSRQTLEDRLRPRRLLIAGIVSAIFGTLLTVHPIHVIPVASGYLASALFVFGAALAAPWLLGALHTLLLWLGGRKLGSARRLALGVLVRSRHRIAPAVAALATAVAMWLSVDMMVQSFRGTVDTWITNTITADLVVTGGGSVSVGKRTLLPMSVFDSLKVAPGIADVDHFRSTQVVIAGKPTLLAMVDMGSVRRQQRLSYVTKPSVGQPTDSLLGDKDNCLISEPLAFRAHLGIGDTLSFEGPKGLERLRVAAIYYDYTSDAGLVLVNRAWFVKRWDDHRIESVAVYLPKGESLEEGRKAIRAAVPKDVNIEIFSNRQLRSAVLDVFDNTFAITYALEGVAIAVALLAVGGGMAALVAERVRELSILRAVGGSRRQLMRRVLFESGLIGAAGWMIGAVLGIVLSLVLTYVVNRYSFGWTLALKLPWEQMWISGVLMIAAALAAGIIPAMHAARIQVAQGVRIDNE